jgi:hypothetical protein
MNQDLLESVAFTLFEQRHNALLNANLFRTREAFEQYLPTLVSLSWKDAEVFVKGKPSTIKDDNELSFRVVICTIEGCAAVYYEDRLIDRAEHEDDINFTHLIKSLGYDHKHTSYKVKYDYIKVGGASWPDDFKELKLNG